MSFKPTSEQQTCVTTYGKKESFKVEAVAGSGKTSTVKLMAESDDTRTALYLAFNKAAATEADGKMPDHVECRTTHSMAYAAFGAEYREKLSRPKGRGYVNVAGTVAEITRFFKVKNTGSLSANGISRMAKLTVAAYESSSHPAVSELNIPQNELLKLSLKADKNGEVFDKTSVVKHVLTLAKKLWFERTTLSSPVLMTHDTYLKMYQLSKPVLDYDVIFLDEAQDTSDCVIDIVMGQADHSQVVCVGDSFQAIYGWRGAVNALAKIPSQSTPLSQSFRYGPRVAAVATHILDGAMQVRGFDQLDTKIGEVDRNSPYVVLFRTNAALIEEGMHLITQGVNVLIDIDTRGYVKKLEAAAALYAGDKKKADKQEDICVFDNWSELKDEAELVKGELARIAKQVESGEWRKTVKTLSTYNKPWDADVTLTTAHKSKGMEYPQVVLADDFPDVIDDEGEYHELPDMERNLIYVATTRAQGCLELNQTVLDIIEHRTAGDDRIFKEGFDIAEDRADMAGYVNDLLLDNEPPF
jgi:superfamily I DNA/RNA helicase